MELIKECSCLIKSKSTLKCLSVDHILQTLQNNKQQIPRTDSINPLTLICTATYVFLRTFPTVISCI